ncbi:MAG: AbrB/MazE/SpoVT family DNA-binding domain-containing protein [Candidatus Limnocylindrales bacterium]|jgi:bifunctional DNA-binding transcriptional regulator/antitoxin component of YhaV-PrlF toxin-antitoxin module|nr:AbrB/MazE/SpoVT family DNA-binding domain-containing protein [Chloroflexota bacterium]
MERVKRKRGYTRLSAKRQVTIPAHVVAEARLAPGDVLRVERQGNSIVLVPQDGLAERRRRAIARGAGSATGAYPAGYLRRLRDEWR